LPKQKDLRKKGKFFIKTTITTATTTTTTTTIATAKNNKRDVEEFV